MTNEEKAKEISCGQAAETDYISSAAYNGAIEMAEWKDQQYSQDEAYNRGIHDACQQFKKYLENKIKTIDSANYDSNWELLNEIINELFGE